MNDLKTYRIFGIQSLQFLARKLQLCPSTRGNNQMLAIQNLLSLTPQVKPQIEPKQSAPFFATRKIYLRLMAAVSSFLAIAPTLLY